MMNKILVVEGQTDIDFFAALLNKEGIDQVKIKPPREYDFSKDTVTHFPALINLTTKQLHAGQIQNLGIIADADYVSGGGFDERWTVLTRPLAACGYRIPNPPKRRYLGTMFGHPDGLPPVGLWIMPDHKSNGMLEDFIESIIKHSPEQDALVEYAKHCIKHLPHRLFSSYQETKSTIYSWLAWQKRPGLTLDVTINADLVDGDSHQMQGFKDWLHKVFPQ